MRFWWVNHNQTFRQEFLGGYIWCPKKKLNGATNHFYETVREVVPGDIVFSYAQTRIQGYGIATKYCYSCPRPDEFGNIGDAWDMRVAGASISILTHLRIHYGQLISAIYSLHYYQLSIHQ